MVGEPEEKIIVGKYDMRGGEYDLGRGGEGEERGLGCVVDTSAAGFLAWR